MKALLNTSPTEKGSPYLVFAGGHLYGLRDDLGLLHGDLDVGIHRLCRLHVEALHCVRPATDTGLTLGMGDLDKG